MGIKTEMRESSSLMRIGNVEMESWRGAGGGYSGIIMRSNCDTNEVVMLR